MWFSRKVRAGRMDTRAFYAEPARRVTVTKQALASALDASHNAYRALDEGQLADGPILSKVSAASFGIAAVTQRGEAVSVGDDDRSFSIQSISKVFTLALVLQQSGEALVEQSVGVDSTGRNWGSIEAVEEHQGALMNPLVTPGAIAITGNVKGADIEDRWNRILDIHSEFAGRKLVVDQAVYANSMVGKRNRAIALLMSKYGRFPADPEQTVDLYERQTSLIVTTKDLSVMAATLANGGTNPITNRQVISPNHVPRILAVMAIAGLYENSGEWLFRTGLPGKSGVGGGLIAVVPGLAGIAAFSPLLDEAGNSVRGQRAIADIGKSISANPYF